MNNKNDLDILSEQDKQVSEGITEENFRKRRSKRAHFPIFYTVYFSVIAIFIIALAFGLRFINNILYEYESTQPKYKAEEVFNEYFKAPDLTELIEMSKTSYAVFESKEEVLAFIGEQFTGEQITFAETVSTVESTHAYNVYSKGVRFATFYLCVGDEKTEHGFSYYKLSDVKLAFAMPDNSYDLLIPEGNTLYANGIEVGESYIAGDAVITDAYKLSGGAAGGKYIPYSVSGFLSTPSFTVKNSAGEETGLTYDENSGVYSIPSSSVTIRIPQGYTAYIENAEVGEQYKKEGSESSSAYNAFLYEGVNGINYADYTVSGFFSLPNVTVKNGDGTECIVRFDEETMCFEALPVYNSTLKAEHEARLIEAFEKYTLYLQNLKYSKSDIRKYFDTSSTTWKNLSSINTGWQFEATSYTFTEESASEFIVYSDECFSCRVQLTYIGRRGSQQKTEVIDMTVFLRKSGSDFLIYNMTATEAVTGVGQPS